MRLEGSLTRAGLAAVYAVFAVYAAIVLLTSPGDALNTFATDWLYQALIAAAAAIAAARAIHVEQDRLAWSVIAAALASTSIAELFFIAVEPDGYPSVSDLFWIAFYPLAYIGMVLLLRRRARAIARPLWLDGLTASVAAAALGAAVLLEVVLSTAEGSRAEVATNLAYPLGDVLLLSAVFGVFSLAGWRIEGRWLLLGLGLLATAVADGVYLFTVDTYQAGSAIDVLWPLSSLLIATAAWVRTHDESQLRTHGRPLLAVPAVCALAAIQILVYDHFARLNLVAVGLAALTLLLVIVRLGLTFRENARLFALTHHESLTDALTGIGNRRRLLADLHRALEPPTPPTLLMIFDLNGFKGYNDSFGHPAGDALLVRLAEKLSASLGGVGAPYRLGGDEFCVVAPIEPGEAELLIDRTCAALVEKGEGFEVTSSFGAVVLPDEATDVSVALSLADERLYAQKQARRGDTSQSMDAFVEALATQEPSLHAHLEGVAALALEVGKRLGLAAGELEELSRAAQLHDLGKVAVPQEILDKPGALDEREWEFIHQHTVVGERILRASPAFRDAATIVRSSHERWDGTGYPDGLAGEEIPPASRIVSACDAFEAMTSTRPYRMARPVDEALAELRRCSGTQFDPAVVDVLVTIVRERVAAA